MIELRLYLQGDDREADRLREILAVEGFRIVDSPGSDAPQNALVGFEESLPAGASRETLARRIEELERTILELRNLDVAKSQFLTNVSHELRTPLTAIVTYGEVLRDGLLGEITQRQREAIESMINSCRQLLSMIEEILMYARTNARAIELSPSEFDLTEVVGHVYDMNASLIQQKSLHYEATLNGGLPAVWADRDKVVHILGNLLGNAIDFTPEAGTLRVQARRSAENPTWLEVAVEDSGIGIKEDDIPKIFEDFRQVDQSSTREYGGTGLGLSITRKLLNLLGGSVRVESTPGAGSVFTVALPLRSREVKVAGDAGTRQD